MEGVIILAKELADGLMLVGVQSCAHEGVKGKFVLESDFMDNLMDIPDGFHVQIFAVPEFVDLILRVVIFSVLADF